MTLTGWKNVVTFYSTTSYMTAEVVHVQRGRLGGLLVPLGDVLADGVAHAGLGAQEEHVLGIHPAHERDDEVADAVFTGGIALDPGVPERHAASLVAVFEGKVVDVDALPVGVDRARGRGVGNAELLEQRDATERPVEDHVTTCVEQICRTKRRMHRVAECSQGFVQRLVRVGGELRLSGVQLSLIATSGDGIANAPKFESPFDRFVA